jgi:hypothetical protein
MAAPDDGYAPGRFYPTRSGAGMVSDALQQFLFERALAQKQAETLAYQRSQDASKSAIEQQKADADTAKSRAELITATRGPAPPTPEFSMLSGFVTADGQPARLNVRTGELLGTGIHTAPKDAPAGSDFQQFLGRYAAQLNKPVGQLTAADELAARKIYGQADDRPAQGPDPNVALGANYNRAKTRLDALRKPVEDTANRVSELTDMINSGTPQADALVAPKLLTVLVGGAGTGVRINQAEIDRVTGGRSKWESLKAAANQWAINPQAANSITPEQRQQIRQLVGLVQQRTQERLTKIQAADAGLLDAASPAEQNRLLVQLQNDLDAQASGGGSSGGVRVVRDANGNLVVNR